MRAGTPPLALAPPGSDARRLIDLFTAIDTDGSGTITAEELVTGLAKLSVPLPPGGAEALIAALDRDGSGEICYHELEIGHRKSTSKPASAAESSSGAQQPEPLRLTLEAFCDLTVHCHYITRP